MTYNYYCEGYSNKIRHEQYFEGYKTLKAARKAAATWRDTYKVVETGHTTFSFDGINKYRLKSYKTIDQFNCKPFYDYWR